MGDQPGEGRRSIRPRDKFQFCVGLLYLLTGGMRFADRNSPYGGTFEHYSWLIWTLGSGVFFYNAYRAPRKRDRAE